MDKILVCKILTFIKNNYLNDPYFGLSSEEIIDSLPEYPRETIINHIVRLCTEDYIIGSNWADDYPQSIEELTFKGNNVLKSLSL